VLKYRLITGPILIAGLLLLVIADDWLDTVTLSGFWQDLFMGKTHPPRGLLLFTVGLVVAPLAALELSAVFRADGIRTQPWLTSAAAMLGLVLSYSVPMTIDSIGTVEAIAIVSTGMILMFVVSLFTFSRQHNVEGVVAAAGAVMFAMVYLGLMFGFLLALRRGHSAWIIVGVILTTKACDTGAYFTGRAFGRHKMIPWLSPGKTWEGLAGGVALATLVGIGAAAASRAYLGEADQVPTWLGAACGAVFAVVGQLGDLTMSLFKREAGIKDSSSILPGLGGVLDVLDSPLLVAPVAFWMLELFL
jgi:phosphatidate cytidylyltransferase